MKFLLLIAIAALSIGILPPIFSYFSGLLPESESRASWFQRSGSIMCIFTFVADFLLALMYTTIFPGENTVVVGGQESESLQAVYIIVSAIALIFTIVGTIIWATVIYLYKSHHQRSLRNFVCCHLLCKKHAQKPPSHSVRNCGR